MTDQIKTREDILTATHQRSVFFKREAVNVEARTVTLAFSSEEPVERWGGTEILDHSPSSCDLNRLRNGGAVLVDHDPRDQVGVVESCQIEGDRVGRAVVRFGRSERAEEVFQDIVDGIRKHVSVGYRVHKLEVTDPESDSVTYRVTLWEPLEISIVSIPADASVGVGRSAEPTPEPKVVPAPKEPEPAPVISARSNTMITEKTPEQIAAEQAEIAKRAADNVETRMKDLLALGGQYAAHKGMELATRAIQEGKDEKWLRDAIMAEMTNHFTKNTGAPDLGLDEKETKRFSVMKLIRAQAAAHKGERDAWKDAGFERECHEALVKRHGDSANGGFYVPYEVQKRQMEKRDLTVAGSGGYLVGTQHQPSSFIELLRANAVVSRAGARMLSGLKGNVEIPKQSGGATAYLVGAEDDEITESQMTIGQLALSPKTLGAYTEVSRLLQMQSDPSVDMLIMDDLAKAIALKIDYLALAGNGAGGPVGVINTSGIGTVTGTSFSYAAAVEFQTDVATGNALVPGCSYITTPSKAGILKQKQRFSSTDTPIWIGNVLEGEIDGFRAMTTTQLSDGMIFGDFSQLIMAEWGILEIAVDPTANFKAGITGVRAFQSFDVGVRNAAAFSYASSITA